MTTATNTDLVYTLFIRATPDEVWDALINPELTSQYFYGGVIDSTLEPGSSFVMQSADGSMRMVAGEVLDAQAPRRLSCTWRTLWVDEAANEDPSRVTWEIEGQADGTTKLTLVHDQLENSPETARSVADGWNYILSGLKTVVETGKPLAV